MIVKCPECEGNISEYAPICPHCGINFKMAWDYQEALRKKEEKETSHHKAKLIKALKIRTILKNESPRKLYDKYVELIMMRNEKKRLAYMKVTYSNGKNP